MKAIHSFSDGGIGIAGSATNVKWSNDMMGDGGQVTWWNVYKLTNDVSERIGIGSGGQGRLHLKILTAKHRKEDLQCNTLTIAIL